MPRTEPSPSPQTLRQGSLWPTFFLAAAALAALGVASASSSGFTAAVCCVAAGAAIGIALMRALQRQPHAAGTGNAAGPGHSAPSELDVSNANLAARWRAIVDTATEGILTIDDRGTVETVNGAAVRLFGWPAEEIVGRNVAQLMPPPYATEHDEYLRRYLSTGERRIIGIGREVVGKRRDGSEFPIDLSVGEGNLEGRKFFTGVIRDITERKQMQTKLAQAERLAAVGELAAGVAHEVNNPINTIINCAQLIDDGDDARSNCRVIIEEGQRVAEIVRDLLQFARDDRDNPQPTSLADAAARSLRLIGENLKRHGIAVRVSIPDDLPPVLARPQQMQQVLLNLLINAKDALLQEPREDRRIELSARTIDDGVQVTVQDNGPGIPGALGDRVFEPFVTTKRARGGTGLGLSISKSIVEGYGGRITVESRPGEGATFRIWLPLADRAE